MKLKNECAREVLLNIEKLPYGEVITVEKLHEKIGQFDIEDVLTIVTAFNKEHYLIVLDKVPYDDNDVFKEHKIKGLTEKGYKTLDLVRDEEFWNSLREKIDNFDELSIYTIFDVANKIKNMEYNSLFNLPKELFIPNNRW